MRTLYSIACVATKSRTDLLQLNHSIRQKHIPCTWLPSGQPRRPGLYPTLKGQPLCLLCDEKEQTHSRETWEAELTEFADKLAAERGDEELLAQPQLWLVRADCQTFSNFASWL